MRRLLPRALVLMVPAWAALTSSAWAFAGLGQVETVYVPTSSVLTVPTSYVVPSSYLFPTSYAVPTVYTSSLAPTYYLSPSAYVVPSYLSTGYLLSSRVVERPLLATRRTYSYYPTTYYPTVWTTTYDYPIVATSAAYPVVDDCLGAPVAASPAPAQPSNLSGAAAPGERRPSSTIDSVPANEPGLTSEPANPATPAPATPPARTEQASPPPAAPAPEPGGEAGAPPASAQPGPTGGAATPPAGAPPIAPGAALGPEATTRREAQRPKPPEFTRPVASLRNILEGRVVSRLNGQPAEGVRLFFADPLGRFENRTAVSDALGRYAVSLADGDWTLSVTMPSGRVLAVNDIRLTVSGGHITDRRGRDIPSLTITR